MKKSAYKIPKSKLPELTLTGLFHSEFINCMSLIVSLYDGELPSYKRYRENFYKEKIVNFLNKNGGQLVQLGEEVLISKSMEDLENEEEPFIIGGEIIVPSFDYEDGSIYFYKDNFIQITSENGKEKDKCKLTFYYPTSAKCVDEEFTQFMDIDKRPNIFMVNQDYGNFNFSKFNINLPETFDIGLNYGKNFESVSEKMIKSLHENSSGLYMLPGRP